MQLKKESYSIPVTEDELLGSFSNFETEIVAGEQFYKLDDPVECKRWWIYFWKLQYDKGWFDKTFIPTDTSLDVTRPVRINLNTMEVQVPSSLAKSKVEHLFFINVSMGTLLFSYAIFVCLWLWLCPVKLGQKCSIITPAIKSMST